MTRQNTHLDAHNYSYQIVRNGPFAGSPAVIVTVGSEIDQKLTIRSLKRQFENWNWTRALGRHAPFIFRGEERENTAPASPLDRKHEEGIVALIDVIGPDTVVMEAQGSKKPVERVRKRTNRYIIRLSLDQMKSWSEGGNEVWEWFADGHRYNDFAVDWLLESYRERDEELLEQFSRRYRVDDQHIYLEPFGDTVEEVEPKFRSLEKIAKRHGWKVTPRLDILFGDTDASG